MSQDVASVVQTKGPWIVVKVRKESAFPSIKAQELFLWLSEYGKITESRPDLFDPSLDNSIRLFSFCLHAKHSVAELEAKIAADFANDEEIEMLSVKDELDISLLITIKVVKTLKFPTVKAQEFFLWLSDLGYVREANADLFHPKPDETKRSFEYLFVGDLDKDQMHAKINAKFSKDPEIIAFFVDTHQKKQAAKDDMAKRSERKIRVDAKKLEEINRLSGELVILKEQVASVTAELNKKGSDPQINESLKHLHKALQGLHKVSEDMQDKTRQFQQTPIGTLLQRFQRIARDTSRKLNKKIECHIEGEETEVDGGLLERVGDLLVHLVRNAVDHGIEPPQVREKVGKPPIGKITLRALHEEDHVVIEVIDDGGGIDKKKLADKALRIGLVDKETLASMSEKEIFGFIFRSGFSTASELSEISGRGVGLDVVKERVEEMNGLIDIHSEVGVGSTFTIRLPLSLSIVHALLVQSMQETFALPLSSILEVSRLDSATCKKLEKNGKVASVGKNFRVFTLAQRLHIGSSLHEENYSDRFLVEVGYGVERYGLIVDRVLGRREIVIRPFGRIPGPISGVIGMATLGDGSIIVVLDPRTIGNIRK